MLRYWSGEFTSLSVDGGEEQVPLGELSCPRAENQWFPGIWSIKISSVSMETSVKAFLWALKNIPLRLQSLKICVPCSLMQPSWCCGISRFLHILYLHGGNTWRVELTSTLTEKVAVLADHNPPYLREWKLKFPKGHALLQSNITTIL